jgi:hypothetical protein
MKTCIKCGLEKPLNDFLPRGNTVRGECRVCWKLRYRQYREDNRERINAQARERHNEDPEKQRSATLKHKYKITAEDFNRLFEAQGNACAICYRKPRKNERRFHVDHDHKCCPGAITCGECVRGILCRDCNITLGLLDTLTKDWVANAVDYLGRDLL